MTFSEVISEIISALPFYNLYKPVRLVRSHHCPAVIFRNGSLIIANGIHSFPDRFSVRGTGQRDWLRRLRIYGRISGLPPFRSHRRKAPYTFQPAQHPLDSVYSVPMRLRNIHCHLIPRPAGWSQVCKSVGAQYRSFYSKGADLLNQNSGFRLERGPDDCISA